MYDYGQMSHLNDHSPKHSYNVRQRKNEDSLAPNNKHGLSFFFPGR